KTTLLTVPSTSKWPSAPIEGVGNVPIVQATETVACDCVTSMQGPFPPQWPAASSAGGANATAEGVTVGVTVVTCAVVLFVMETNAQSGGATEVAGVISARTRAGLVASA